MIVVQFFLGTKSQTGNEKSNYDDLDASKGTRPTLLPESAVPELVVLCGPDSSNVLALMLYLNVKPRFHLYLNQCGNQETL
jgi:hypothetical protein